MQIHVKCGACKNKFRVKRKQIQDGALIYCPMCNQDMTEAQSERIQDIYLSLYNWNHQNKKSHEDYGKPLFTATIR